MRALKIYLNKELDPEMGESLVGFCHPVRIFFLFESCAFALTGGYQFIGQFVCHGTAIAFTAVANDPFHA